MLPGHSQIRTVANLPTGPFRQDGNVKTSAVTQQSMLPLLFKSYTNEQLNGGVRPFFLGSCHSRNKFRTKSPVDNPN